MNVLKGVIDTYWQMYDRDSNGYLDQREARSLMDSVFSELKSSVPITNAEFEAAFKSFDRDGSGGISKEEMADFIAQAAGLNKGNMKTAVQAQDLSNPRIGSDFKHSLMGGFS